MLEHAALFKCLKSFLSICILATFRNEYFHSTIDEEK